MVSNINSQQEDAGIEFWVEFAYSTFACVGSIWLLWLPAIVQKMQKLGVRLIGHSTLSTDLNVCVDSCLSLYVSTVVN